MVATSTTTGKWRRSNINAQRHAGYQPIMPALAEQIGGEGLAALVDYILSLQ